MRATPKVQLILDYKTFFGTEPPEDRISLIQHISRTSILYEFAALNYRLKPKDKIHIDNSIETQLRELDYFTKTRDLFIQYVSIFRNHVNSDDHYPIIFNRQACLFAMEEILNSTKMRDIEDFVMAKIDVWERIIKYLLAVNYTITQINLGESDQKPNFESLNPKLLSLNELLIETDQIFTPFRGYWLISYFLNRPRFTSIIIKYFNDKYGIEPEHFVFKIMSIYLANDNNNPEFNFHYLIEDENERLFEKLSERITNKETHKLISIRKSPFIKVGARRYLLADNSFLIEKLYSQFINDFWFDSIKFIKDETGELKFNIQNYRSEFGYFFEQYLSQTLIRCFANYKYSTLLMFDQLRISTSKGNIEIADVYFRYGNKILLGQVKSRSIYDIAKYGGTVEKLYENNRTDFFKNFGVDQIVESIAILDKQIQSLDPKFPAKQSRIIFPCLFVNDKALQTPLMSDIFNKRFNELVSNLIIKKVKINPLTLIHISDLERMEDSLHKNPKEIWSLLKYHHRDKKFVPPFYDTINQKLSGRKYPPRIMELFRSLILRYNPEGAQE